MDCLKILPLASNTYTTVRVTFWSRVLQVHFFVFLVVLLQLSQCIVPQLLLGLISDERRLIIHRKRTDGLPFIKIIFCHMCLERIKTFLKKFKRCFETSTCYTWADSTGDWADRLRLVDVETAQNMHPHLAAARLWPPAKSCSALSAGLLADTLGQATSTV